jgi:hypothetical protein
MCAEQHPELSSGYFSISSLQLEVPEIVNEIKFWFLYPSFLLTQVFPMK